MIALANLKNVEFIDTSLVNSYFQENRIKNLILKNANLKQAHFFKTSLTNVDLSNSNIEGIIISLEDIGGAIINEFQCIDLSYLMGIKLKK